MAGETKITRHYTNMENMDKNAKQTTFHWENIPEYGLIYYITHNKKVHIWGNYEVVYEKRIHGIRRLLQDS